MYKIRTGIAPQYEMFTVQESHYEMRDNSSPFQHFEQLGMERTAFDIMGQSYGTTSLQ